MLKINDRNDHNSRSCASGIVDVYETYKTPHGRG